jgi:CPA1 family monovalent cation:H+ antiporter
MPLVDLVVLLMILAVGLGWLARRIGVPYPIALTIGGLALTFVPGLPTPRLDPEQILVLVLPPILYHAALHTSWREFRQNLRAITLLAVGLVVFTTVVLAWVAKLLLPDLPWVCCFIIGALLSPPDAVAATAVLSKLRIPRRVVAILEGESLLNDAAGLVVYKFAVAAALTGLFSVPSATAQFGLLAIGGMALGAVVGRIAVALQSRLRDPVIEVAFILTMPYLVYIGAEQVHVSGVLAVVTFGAVRAWYAPELYSPETRILAYGVWNIVVFMINSLVFILIGLQLSAVSGYRGIPLDLLGIGLTLAAAATAGRFVWVFAVAWVPRKLIPVLGARNPMPSWRMLTVISWCGMRGIVSLAAALAVPYVLSDGSAFPGRDEIIAVSFVAIVATLLFQGLTLAPLIRSLGIGEDSDLAEEEHLARLKTAYAALSEVERLASTDGRYTEEAVVAVRAEYAGLLGQERTAETTSAEAADPVRRLKLAAIAAARRRLIKLRRDDQIGDETLLLIQRELDYEEARLGG